MKINQNLEKIKQNLEKIEQSSVQKSVGRCILIDFIQSSEDPCFENLIKYRGVTLNDTYENATLFKEIEKACVEVSKDIFNEKTMPSLQIAANVGNMYSPSLYSSLCSLLCNKSIDDLLEKRIALFSYGSGLASAMFSLKVSSKKDELEPLIRVVMDCYKRLDQRKEVEPEDFVKTLELREKRYNAKSYTPQSPIADLFPGTFYLVNVDDKFRRTYERKT